MQVWVNGDSDENVAKIAKTLDQEIQSAKPKLLKAFILYIPSKGEDTKALSQHLQKLSDDNKLQDVALLYVQPGDGAMDDYKINQSPDVKNTVLVYVNRQIKSNIVNLKADDAGTADLKAAVEGIIK